MTCLDGIKLNEVSRHDLEYLLRLSVDAQNVQDAKLLSSELDRREALDNGRLGRLTGPVATVECAYCKGIGQVESIYPGVMADCTECEGSGQVVAP
jgi:DnaJ-class molecular chaperone